MRRIFIVLISALFIYSCGNSPEKLLKKGDNYIKNSEVEKALSTYQKIIDKFPDDSLAQQAEYNIAWTQLNENLDFVNGFETLNNIVENYPETEIGKIVKEDIANYPKWLMTKTSDMRNDSTVNEALTTVDYLISNFGDNSIIPEALYLKGNIYLNDKKDFYRAINTYQEIVHKYKGSSFEPMSQFMIGYIYANVQSDTKKAKTAYTKFLENYPEHELAPSVQFELEYLGKQIKDIEDLKSRNN